MNAVNDVRGCRGDGMLEEGVEMWPISIKFNINRIGACSIKKILCVV